MNARPLVIYHDHCTDGFAAAFAAWLKLGDDADYLPMAYGDIPEVQDLRGDALDDVEYSGEYTKGVKALKAELAKVKTQRDRLEKGIEAVQCPIDESDGVSGLHRNGDEFDIRAVWAAADKKARDWRTKGDMALLMHDAWAGLKECGWKEIEYCPKDGTRFLAICAGSTGVFPHYYQGEWPKGSWWAEAHGDLWPSRPILFKLMPDEALASIKVTP